MQRKTIGEIIAEVFKNALRLDPQTETDKLRCFLYEVEEAAGNWVPCPRDVSYWLENYYFRSITPGGFPLPDAEAVPKFVNSDLPVFRGFEAKCEDEDDYLLFFRFIEEN